jgi:anti-sigma B factor antagonist
MEPTTSMNLKVTPRRVDDTTVSLDLEGEVDVYTAPELKQAIISQVDASTRRVLVNLEKVEYLDSTGLGILIGGVKRLKEVEGTLLLVSASPRIRRLFEITQLNTIFRIVDTEAEALSAA